MNEPQCEIFLLLTKAAAYVPKDAGDFVQRQITKHVMIACEMRCTLFSQKKKAMLSHPLVTYHCGVSKMPNVSMLIFDRQSLLSCFTESSLITLVHWCIRWLTAQLWRGRGHPQATALNKNNSSSKFESDGGVLFCSKYCRRGFTI